MGNAMLVQTDNSDFVNVLKNTDESIREKKIYIMYYATYYI